MADHRHGVVALVPLDRHDVPALPDGDHRRVSAKPGWVYPDDDGRAQVFVLFPRHRVIHQTAANELVVAGVRERPVHLNVRLVRVRPVLRDDLLVDLFVSTLDRARVYLLAAPKVPLAVEGFVEVPRVAARVAERQPEPVGRVLCEEAACHRPDRVVDAAGFVEHHHDAVVVVDARVGVRILSRPQPTLDAPVPRAFL